MNAKKLRKLAFRRKDPTNLTDTNKMILDMATLGFCNTTIALKENKKHLAFAEEVKVHLTKSGFSVDYATRLKEIVIDISW